MWIASKLYQDGEISSKQLAEAICTMTRGQKRLGQIALEKRFLSVKQVMKILAEQAKSPKSKFGELAVELGYLSREKLSQLLGEQVFASPSLFDVIHELGYIAEEQPEHDSSPTSVAHCGVR